MNEATKWAQASVIILGQEQQEENHTRMVAVRSDFASQCCWGCSNCHNHCVLYGPFESSFAQKG